MEEGDTGELKGEHQAEEEPTRHLHAHEAGEEGNDHVHADIGNQEGARLVEDLEHRGAGQLRQDGGASNVLRVVVERRNLHHEDGQDGSGENHREQQPSLSAGERTVQIDPHACRMAAWSPDRDN